MSKVSMNVTTTFHGNILTDIRIAKEAGFSGIELQTPKLFRYLDAGFSAESLLPHLEGITVTGVGAALDAERDGEGRERFLADVKRLSQVAEVVGAPIVQVCTGPVDWNVVKDFKAGRLTADDARYRGTLGLSDADAVSAVARNVRDAADIAADHGAGIFLEPLAWSNINRCAQALRIIEEAGRPNVGLAVDTWHFWTVGDTLEEVAALPKELISVVHISDGLDLDRANDVPDQSVHRDVVIGGGAIPLQQWVDAVKSTGYDGWWASEMFSTKGAEGDLLEVARTIRGLVDILVS
ncbi:sugar phosphate isomerase/epimerase family protein [Gryllotalpicola ginsengisoli]|uniref:sugar phosphate isomerase/epimerase family protein n=1 Tax=Gryllotalpicola ginsengisoli TaxID=444608 RepID=UPI0003B5A0BE|nr:sugar phosphate isomerase/epimerase family protein [Gryllotalpicola ginsengisoli]